MGVYIKGMEMPECCDECVFMETQDSGFGNDYICGISKKDVDGVCDCPLIEVPPHGRLIDADLLGKILKRGAEEEWNKNTAPFSWSYAYECLSDTLDSMPTVIESEE